MADIQVIKIGDMNYYLCDATVQSGLSGKQNTISDLSTIRSNASTGKSQAATAITRIGNFSFSVVTARNIESKAITGASVAGALGSEYNIRMNDKTAPSGHTFLGTSGWYTGNAALITTRLAHSSGITNMFVRNMTTTPVALQEGDASCRDIYFKKG